MSVNVRAIANQYTSILHANYTFTWYRALGEFNIDGKMLAKYESPISVKVQLQSLRPDEEYHTNSTSQNAIVRRIYINTSVGTIEKPSGLIRPFARTGDMFLHPDGTWWRITAPAEDFNMANWCAVYGQLQARVPDFTHSDWWEG